MKIVIRDSQKHCYISAFGGYTAEVDDARDFTSVTGAHQFCRNQELSKHVVILISSNMIVSEMNLGDC